MIRSLLVKLFGRKADTPPAAAETSKKQVGQYGEEQAAAYLKDLGYRILERNCRVGGHEVDIIARDGRFAVFCEVKTRTLSPEALKRFGRPALSVSKEQRKNLAKAASAYLYRHRGMRARFDILEVYLDPNGKGLAVDHITHMKDAFRH